MQWGDPTNSRRGGESIYDGSRYFRDEGFGQTFHSCRGVLTMAKKGRRSSTNASQFLILFSPQQQLDGVHTACDVMVDGDEVLQRIEQLPVGGDCVPTTDILFLDATVLQNPFAGDMLPEPDAGV